MSLLQAPRFNAAGAELLARELYGAAGSASPLPSERDQNFLLTTTAGDRYVLKIANGGENRAMLEAQNAAMAHVAPRVGFCPRVVPARSGDTIALTPDGHHFIRLVTYLDGVPLAKAAPRTPALFENLGRAVGQLDAALADFDHPAIHRDFHWDLVNAGGIVREHIRIVPGGLRVLVADATVAALQALDAIGKALRQSAVHHDANDWNVLVDAPPAGGGSPGIAGIIDFGDMVYSWTVADPAVAAAYAMLDAPDPIASVAAVAAGYHRAYPLREEELAALFPLAVLRLCMSVAIAAWQQRQRPGDDYLGVSQEPIRRTLPALAAIDQAAAAQAIREAAG